MSVRVEWNEASNTLEFHTGNGEHDSEIAHYLNGLVRDNRTVKKSQGALAAKVRLADTVIKARAAQEEKVRALESQAAAWTEKSLDWSQSHELRQLLAERARQAREEARRITAELGGE